MDGQLLVVLQCDESLFLLVVSAEILVSDEVGISDLDPRKGLLLDAWRDVQNHLRVIFGIERHIHRALGKLVVVDSGIRRVGTQTLLRTQVLVNSRESLLVWLRGSLGCLDRIFNRSSRR